MGLWLAPQIGGSIWANKVAKPCTKIDSQSHQAARVPGKEANSRLAGCRCQCQNVNVSHCQLINVKQAWQLAVRQSSLPALQMMMLPHLNPTIVGSSAANSPASLVLHFAPSLAPTIIRSGYRFAAAMSTQFPRPGLINISSSVVRSHM